MRRRVQRFAGGLGERAVGFRVSEKKNRFHGMVECWSDGLWSVGVKTEFHYSNHSITPFVSFFDPLDDFLRDVVRRFVLHDFGFAQLFRQRHARETQAFAGEFHRLGLLQRRHHGAHVDHADLRIVFRLRQIARGPAEQRRRAGAFGNLMLAAFDALQNFQRTVGVDLQFVHALKLVHDAEAFADHLHRRARAARGGFPAAEDEQLGFVETGNGLDGLGQRGGDFGRVGEAAGRTVERDEFKRHFLRDGHHHLLELGLRAEADEPDFAAGRVLGQIRRLVKRVARPRIEDGGQHHFIFQRRPGRAGRPAPASGAGPARCCRKRQFDRLCS